MKYVCIQIKLLGTWCNDWPDIKITINDSIYFEGKIKNEQILNFNVPCLSKNTLIIQHFNKKFGENGQWDTISDNNKIMHDRAVKLEELRLDDVSIYKYVIEKCPFISNNGEQIFTDYFGFNGLTKIEFGSPIYDWIICNIVKPNYQNVTSDLEIETSHANLFDYDQDLKEIKEIEKILTEYAHLFNKSSKI